MHGNRDRPSLTGHFVQFAGRRLGRALARLLAKLLVWSAPVWVPVVLALVAVTLIFSAMPQSGALGGAQPGDADPAIRQAAESAVAEVNAAETWLNSPDGSREHLGQLADAYGRDAQLVLKWSDIYTPLLARALATGEDTDLFSRPEAYGQRLQELARRFGPRFEYYPSTVVITDAEGNSEEYAVYLLRRSDTLAGTYEYQYERVTDQYPDGSSRTYDRPAGQRLVSQSYERLDAWIGENIDPKDADMTRRMILEASRAFDTRKEWVDWMLSRYSSAFWASGAMVPSELVPLFQEAEEKYGIPWWFLAAVAFTESSFNPLAENPSTGCYGLMQVAPANWQEYAPQLGFDVQADRDNPRAQILLGAFLLKSYFGSVDWNADDWRDQTLRGLTFYGGFRTNGEIDAAAMERCRNEYAGKIWELADAFRGTGTGGTWPVPGHTQITSYFGWRVHPITGERKFHEGIDIAAPEGAPVAAVAGGMATVNPDAGGYGMLVTITDGVHEYRYAHLSGFTVQSGQVVKAGEQIGLVGSTGASTGPHLHFEVRVNGQPVDPLPLLRPGGEHE
ncbi:M23 family metallopeptidase [Desulfurispora thermophila]|uniref:M23 family metallopeptidase n=1 Tax=Desulfurispora thermophila TaxID=265470 RepID=UPI0003756AD5|nr:M23 family metallopeptidase [Desulfurispora thermophila]